jgi:predicted nucleotidyltransferase
MNAKSLELLDHARRTAADLSKHVVLKEYWNNLSLILKGSTSRGNADEYSDIDLVIFCPEVVKAQIVAGYFAHGFSPRQDGIFMMVENGHYHVEAYDQLRGYFLYRDYVHCWDYQNAIPLHEPAGQYAAIIQDGRQALFADPLPILKRAYLDLQLDLDWMRMPIQRSDGPSSLLHMTKLLAGISHMAYLLDCQSYPPDKWLFTFLSTTRFGQAHGDSIQAYFQTCPGVLDLHRDQPFENNPLYTGAAELLKAVGESIQMQYGDQAWLGRWYDFV